MQALRAVVIFMGVLIFAGLGVIGVTLYNRAQGTAETPGSTSVPLEQPQGFGELKLDLPTGSRVMSVRAEGEQLLVLALTPDGAQRLIVVHLSTGTVLGTILVTNPQ